MRWGWLRENIAERAKPPRVSNRRVTAPAVEVVQQIIEEAERRYPHLAPLLMFAALTGMRRGELCAHRWSDETDLDLPELAGAETVGRITVTQLDWWNAHSDAFSEAVAVAEWDELHVERRSVGPVIEERPVQRLTMTVEEAAVVLGISRATAYDAVSRGEIPCIRIGRRILIPKVALERLLEGAGGGAQP